MKRHLITIKRPFLLVLFFLLCLPLVSATVTWQMWCENPSSETITFDYSIFDMDTQTASNYTIQSTQLTNSTSNITSTISLSAGTHTLIKQNFTMQNGTEMHALGTIIAQSNSGIQTPTFMFTADNGMSCTPRSNRRTLANNNDLATIKMYSNCNGTIGQEYNISLQVIVPTSETLLIKDESLTLFEVNELDISQGNLPPIITIQVPVFDANLSGTSDVNYTVTDPNGDLNHCNVSLLNLDNTLNSSLQSVTTNTSISVDWSVFDVGNYKLQSLCIDDVGLTGNDTINVSLVSTAVSNISLPTLTSGACTVSSTFTVTGGFFINSTGGAANATGTFMHNIPSSCSIFSGNQNGTFNQQNNTFVSNAVVYTCTVAANYDFNFTATSGATTINTNKTVTCSASAGGTGLTADQSACLLNGTLVNGTLCPLGTLARGARFMNSILALIGVIAVFVVFSLGLDNEHRAIKTVLFYLSLAFAAVLLYIGKLAAQANDTTSSIVGRMNITYVVLTWVISAFVVYMFVYMVWRWIGGIKAKKDGVDLGNI